MRAGPVCEVSSEQKLHIWLPLPDVQNVIWTASGNNVAPIVGPQVVENGTSFVLSIPGGATELSLRLPQGPHRVATWKLPLAPATLSPTIQEARALRSAGNSEAAETIAKKLLDATPSDRARALGILARINLSRNRIDDAIQGFRSAIAADKQAGLVSDEVSDAFALSYCLSQRARKYGEARDVLDSIQSSLLHFPEGYAKQPYYRSTIALATNDVRTALRWLTEAVVRTSRLGLLRDEFAAKEAIGVTLRKMGRPLEAAVHLEKLDEQAPSDTPACHRATLANNIGYAALSAVMASADGDKVDNELLHKAVVHMTRSVRIFETTCPEPHGKAEALTELARIALMTGDRDVARSRLAQARITAREATGVLPFVWLELDGRLALAERRPSVALQSFQRMGHLAAAALKWEYEWMAVLGAAESIEALKRYDEAAKSYERAEDLLQIASLAMPFGEGRGTFLADHERGARARIQLLMHLGRHAEAMLAARQSRARLLALTRMADSVNGLDGADKNRWEQAISAYRKEREALDAEVSADWTLSDSSLAQVRRMRADREKRLRFALDDALAISAGANETKIAPSGDSVEPGALMLAYHPVLDGWAGFAMSGNRKVVGKMLGRLSPVLTAQALTERLLDPFQSMIDEATHVAIMPYGELRKVDFHALPWKGSPLVAAVPVAYSLDLGGATFQSDGAQRRTALVVANPTGDLSNAQREGALVKDALDDAHAWEPRVLWGGYATSMNLMRELPGAGLFHYAGHGVHKGDEGLDSHLVLAQDTRLSVGDILALSKSPEIVILSACDAARATRAGSAEGLGLAQAFVMAGTRVVLAPTRPTDDKLSFELSVAAVRAMGTSPVREATAALRLAQLAIRQRHPDGDWAAFRAVTR